MITLIYIRISTTDQKVDRQEAELKEWAERTGAKDIEVLQESVSGSVAFQDREVGKRLKRGDIKRLVALSLDRLGRNALDIQATIQCLADDGVNVTITDLGIDSLTPDGKFNPAARIVLAVLAHVAEMERETILERQRQGIAVAKANGKYKGRKPGTGLTPTQLVAKYPKLAKDLQKGESIRRAARLHEVSKGTVERVKKALCQIQ